MKSIRRIPYMLISIVLPLLLIVIVGFWPGEEVVGKNSPEQNSSDRDVLTTDGVNSPEVTAIVVVKSATGKSYLADRNSILTMPELQTEAEIQAFISQYEPLPENAAVVRQSLENAGITIVAQDNLFTFISAPIQQLQIILPAVDLSNFQGDTRQVMIFDNQELSQAINGLEFIDGIILSSPITQDIGHPESNILEPDTPPQTATYVASYEEMLQALKLDLVHRYGLTGTGVKVGFIDEGVFSGHPFFTDHPANMKFFRYVHGIITQVGNNFNEEANTGHGTAVASFLDRSAPDASFYSFATPTYDWEQHPDNFVAGYLGFINQYHLVDIVSLSQAFWEEASYVSDYLPEIRTEFINLISKKIIVVVGAGNHGQCIAKYCSGHNAMAAIPEVIAVGGSELVPTGSSFVFKAAAGASSFSSLLFPGRHVPDIVGIYGNFYIPDSGSSYKLGGGTSFATPQIAGMIALLKEKNPGLSQSQVKAILENNAFDIVEGESGDGDQAGPGYDLATGSGQPLAHWVVQETMTLNSGWNLIGVTKDYPYTGASLLTEITNQGGECTNISYWDTSTQSYRSLAVFDGSVFGFDFDIDPSIGYWVKCSGKTFWRQSGSDYIDTEIPIQFKTGWNGISIPYSSAPCTTGELNSETNDRCWKIVEYDGQLNAFESRFIDYGYNFTLSPGKGYMVLCDGDVTWTPTCTNTNILENEPRLSIPNNQFTVQTSVENNPQPLSTTDSVESAACVPQDVNLSNMTNQSFTISWHTDDPCPGAILIHQPGEADFNAYDDRGLQFAGTTHHITVRGLAPQALYFYALVSGTIEDGYYSIETAKTLSQPNNNYIAMGSVLDEALNPASDAIVYVWLHGSDDTYSASLSFPLSEGVDGFSIPLGNARDIPLTNYFSFSSVDELTLLVEGGSAGQQYESVAVNLPTNPNVLTPTINLGVVPNKPVIIAPTNSLLDLRPTFRFKTSGDTSQVIKYRLELSRDNFNTIQYIYDQRSSTAGWSASSYHPGVEARFKIPISLENMSGYQWRVFAYHVGEGTWSSASNIASFSIVSHNIYAPFLVRK